MTSQTAYSEALKLSSFKHANSLSLYLRSSLETHESTAALQSQRNYFTPFLDQGCYDQGYYAKKDNGNHHCWPLALKILWSWDCHELVATQEHKIKSADLN